MIKKLTIIAVLIFSFYFTWLIPQVVVTIQMTSQAMEQNLGEPSSESIQQAGSHSGLADLLEYCIHDESRGDMSAIGQEYEIGILQFKVPTWLYLSDKYNFDGSICNPDDQKELFLRAVKGGDCGHWTCCNKYQNEFP